MDFRKLLNNYVPILCSSKLFENHNIIYLYSSDVINGCKKIGKYLSYNFFQSRSEKESYLFLKDGKKIIALLVYFFYELDYKIPAIDIVVVEEEYRRKGITTFFYNYLLEKHKALISGICLNKNDRKIDGSFGLWMKHLIPKHETKLFNIFKNKTEKYSYWKAFKSPSSMKRRIIIFKKDA